MMITSPATNQVISTSTNYSKIKGHYSPIKVANLPDPLVLAMKEKKLKYKKLARKFKEQLGRREQEMTDLIMDNQNLKQQIATLKHSSSSDNDKLRNDISRLMDENHHMQRDLDRYISDNSSLKSQLNDFKAQHESVRADLHKLLVDKESEIDRLLNDITSREAETQRLQTRCRDSDTVRSQLLQVRDLNERLEAERREWRAKVSAFEQRVQELSELMNLELQKGFESEKEKQQMRIDQQYQIEELERGYQLRVTEKDREILMLKSEVVRAQESSQEVHNQQKKLHIKFEQEALEYQLQIKTLTRINDEIKDEMLEVALIEEKMLEKNQIIESLAEEVDDLKEQILMHKLRLVPLTNVADTQSGNKSSTEQDLVRLTQQNRQLNSEVAALKRKIDDHNFKTQSIT